jgi:hypothetical protein
MMETSERRDLNDKGRELRESAERRDEQRREHALDAATSQMVRRYASAVALAQKTPLIDQAITRLAYYTGILGEARMREYVTSTPDPSDPSKKLPYTAGQYEQMRRP